MAARKSAPFACCKRWRSIWAGPTHCAATCRCSSPGDASDRMTTALRTYSTLPDDLQGARPAHLTKARFDLAHNPEIEQLVTPQAASEKRDWVTASKAGGVEPGPA